MKRTMQSVLVLAALAAFGAIDATAQDEVEDRRRFRRGPGVEAIMQMRERLELTDEQLATLDAIRAEAVQRRSAEAAELAEMRSQLAAGQIQRSDMMAFMEDRRAANVDVAEEFRGRIDAVLTEGQRETLVNSRERAFAGRGQLRRGDRGFRRGGRDFRRGRPGMRPGRPGFRRGGRGMRRGRPGFDRRQLPMGRGRPAWRGRWGAAVIGGEELPQIESAT